MKTSTKQFRITEAYLVKVLRRTGYIIESFHGFPGIDFDDLKVWLELTDGHIMFWCDQEKLGTFLALAYPHKGLSDKYTENGIGWVVDQCVNRYSEDYNDRHYSEITD